MSSPIRTPGEDYISISKGPGDVVDFHRQAGVFKCICEFESSNESLFRAHYRDTHTNQSSTGLFERVSRTFSYVASVLSTPKLNRTNPSLLDTQSPSKRRRIMSNDTEIIEIGNSPYTTTRASPSSAHLPSFTSNLIPQLTPVSITNAPASNTVLSITPSAERTINPLAASSSSSFTPTLFRRESIVSMSSDASTSSEESVHPNLSVHNQTMDPEAAESHLRSLGLFVHQPTNVVVCVQCSNGILVSNAFAHITTASSKCRNQVWKTLSAPSIENCLRACGALNPVKLPSKNESITPIPIIPILDGWVCTVDSNMQCYYQCFTSTRSRERHFHEQHPDVDDRHKHYAAVKAQRIYSFRGDQRCIRVHLRPPNVDPPRYDAFISSLPNADPLPDGKTISLVTQKTVFESITKWDTALIGVDIRVLKMSARPPYTDSPEYTPLTELIVDYITNNVAEKVKNGGHRQILQQVHSPEATILHKSPLRYPKKKETLDSYARIFSCYLTMIVRSVKKPIPGYPIHMTAEQTALSLELYSMLDDPDIPQSDLHLQIHKLCWELLSHHPIESTFEEVNTPILRFLIAHSLVADGDGNFQKSKLISHTLSAIQWCWQAIGYNECLRHAPEYPDGAFGAYRERVKPYLQEAEHTPFTTLRTMVHINTSIAENEQTLPRFVLAMDKSHFTIDAHPITFARFKEYAIDLVSKAEMQLYQVLRGCDIDDIDTQIKAALQLGDHRNAFHDRLHDIGAGYSLFSDTRNPLKKERHRLLQHFLREGCDEFSTTVPGSKYSEVFKPVNCHLWLDEVDSLVSTIYAAAVTTWPGAGRGTELDHLTYRNDHGKRHLFIINNVLTFITTYVKTQQITGRAPLIPRGIDPRLARVLIITINYVYYAAAAICAQLTEPEQAVSYTRYVFVMKGKPMTADRMTKSLQEHTKPVFHKAFGIRDWRHIMKFVLRHLANIQLDAEDEEQNNQDPINALFGHGGRIGNRVYAIESSSISTNSSIDIAQAHRYGIVYQKALGLWSGISKEAFEPLDEDDLQSSSTITQDSLATIMKQVYADGQRRTTASLQTILDTRITAIGDQLTSMVARALYNNMPHPTPPHLPSSCAVNVHPSRLDTVSKLYKSNSFHSPQQAAMYEFILQNTYTVFGVLPTGGGKSLMFYGPPMEEESGITIVISPFVALSDEQFETATEMGICVDRWPSKSTDMSTTRLLIVSAHAAGTNEFVAFVRASVEHGMIRRILYDEAHQILLSPAYRDCYDTLPLITQTGVRVHFLSATLLPSSIDEIVRIACIPMDTVYTIRAPTFRPNIRYDAQHFSSARNYDANHQLMDRVQELCSQHIDKLDDEGRMLIYCSSYDECDEVRSRTGYPIHRTRGSTGEEDTDDAKKRQAVAHDWRMGQPKVLIATTGFGNGIDYPHVRTVISVNAHNGSDAVQQTGRAGRDGRPSDAYILGSRPLLVSNIPDPDHAGVSIIHMLYASSDCIRICLGEFDLESYSCVSHSNNKALLCSRCQSLTFIKTVSLIPAHPGPRNYIVEAQKSKLLSQKPPAKSKKAARNVVYTPDHHPQSSTHPQNTPFSRAKAPVASQQPGTPALTSTATLGPDGYPTPPDNAYIVQRSAPQRRKGKEREVTTDNIIMAPPPVPTLPRRLPDNRQAVPASLIHDVFINTQQNPERHTPTTEQSHVYQNETAFTPYIQHRHFSLPPIPPYRTPMSVVHHPNQDNHYRPRSSVYDTNTPINIQTGHVASSTRANRNTQIVYTQPPSDMNPTLLTNAHRYTPQATPTTIRSVNASRDQMTTARQAMLQTRKVQFAYIDRFFEIHESFCNICLLLGDADTKCEDNLYHSCVSGLFNPQRAWVQFPNGIMAATQFNAFRTQLRFNADQHVCYHCMRQIDIDAHPHYTDKASCSQYADVIKNFAWAVYCLPYACYQGEDQGQRWQCVLLDTFDPPPPKTRPQFERWLTATQDPQGLNITNILLLCIRWAQMHDNQTWPPP